MSKAMAEVANFPLKSTRKAMVHSIIHLVLGGSGAVNTTDTTYPDPDFAVVKPSGTGIYDVTFPPCAKAYCRADVVYSAAPGTSAAVCVGTTDVVATSGTWSFTVYNLAHPPAAVNPASGEKIDIHIWAEVES